MTINEIIINGTLFSHANKTISVDVNLKLVLLYLAIVLVFTFRINYFIYTDNGRLSRVLHSAN